MLVTDVSQSQEGVLVLHEVEKQMFLLVYYHDFRQVFFADLAEQFLGMVDTSFLLIFELSEFDLHPIF